MLVLGEIQFFTPKISGESFKTKDRKRERFRGVWSRGPEADLCWQDLRFGEIFLGSEDLINLVVTADDDPISKYNIDEKKFIVVMVAKPKAAPAPATPDSPRRAYKAACKSAPITG